MNEFLKYCEEINDTSYRGELFTIEDIEKALSYSCFNNINIYVLLKDEQKQISPSLSIIKYYDNEKQRNVFLRFTTIKELMNNLIQRSLWPLHEKDGVHIIDGDIVYLIIETEIDIKDELVEELYSCISVIIHGTLNYQNISRDYIALKTNKLKKELSLEYDLNNLCEFIEKEERISVGYFLISPRNDVNKYYSTHELPFDYKTKKYNDLLKESLTTSKPISFFNNDSQSYSILIPVIRKAQESRFIRNIIIVWSKDRIKSFSVSNIIELINYFLYRKLVNQRLHSLIELQNEIISDFNDCGYDNKSTLLENFRAFSHKCLKQITESTFAYSAVLRLYDPNKKSLTRFLMECNQFGEWDGCKIDSKNEHIELKDYKQSVNAFSFVMAVSLRKQNKPFVYIENFNSGIPKEYSKLGLSQILIFRNTSLSEICFPLFIGNVPFGTLNIESPIRNAFSGDIEYLTALKQSIESFYDINLKRNDSSWLADRSPVYTNVHELKQILRKDSKAKSAITFTPAQTELLNKLILLDDEIPESEIKNITQLKDDITEFLKSNIDKLTYQEVISSLFNWFVDIEILIANHIYQKIKLIILNLFENVINHSSIESDKVFIETDSKDVNNIFLKIRVRTIGVFDEETLSYLSYSPIKKNNSLHYGMFLVGMLARNLGGACFIENSKNAKNNFTIIEVNLPINILQNERC